MRVLQLSVGRPREIEWHGEIVETSIFKEPVTGRRWVRTLDIEGDEQSDLTVHGGVNKAVYAYPSEHYAFWRRELATEAIAWSAFGENLTTEGLLETSVHIGDAYRIGTAELIVTQPRLPCYKLGIRFGRADMVKRFQHSGRSGFYLAVTQEGELQAGDPITLIDRDRHKLRVADVVALIDDDAPDPDLLERAAVHPSLPGGWRDRFRKRLEKRR